MGLLQHTKHKEHSADEQGAQDSRRSIVFTEAVNEDRAVEHKEYERTQDI